METDSRLEPLVAVWGTAVVATSDFSAGRRCWVQIVIWIKDDFWFQDTVFVKGFLSERHEGKLTPSQRYFSVSQQYPPPLPLQVDAASNDWKAAVSDTKWTNCHLQL